jgi:isoleucyl-tRNA synthetase
MTEPSSRRYDPPALEERIVEFWKEHQCFQRSVSIREGAKPFIFLEGPPTANGLPGIHSVEARAFKDMVCRYKTMHGHLVERMGGWDTHGLPVELEVEAELDLHDKKAIEDYGIERFNAKCRESVFRYVNEWKQMSDRMAFWIDMDDPYITLNPDYMESVWWSLRQLWDKGLIEKGVRVVPYCPRCGTTLSSHEVAQGYRDTEDPSITIKFKLKGKENAFILAWTTTPWTLISNVALAVNPEERYALVHHNGDQLILARDLLDSVLGEGTYETERTFFGDELEGQLYEPLFDFVEVDKHAYFVATAEWVTLEEGTTGVVHTAPAFGEEDAELGLEYDLPSPQPVDDEGRFTEEVTKWAGRFVKDADEEIMADLKDRGLLFNRSMYTHTYPFCWRCDSPLLYYTLPSWYIRMSTIREKVQATNQRVNWFPGHLQSGRFGDFLENLKDWSLSRDRYWGTPLPIWNCTSCDHQHCVGSVEELRSLARVVPEGDLDLHRPYIDKWVLSCPECGEDMARESSVIDVWYDSGSAFFAQWHYPFENEERFKTSYPVDFISEAMDQTRGWFYTLHAIAGSVFDDLCYRNCLALGLIQGKDGKRMSKSRGNAVDPWDMFNRHGADATRWYMFSINPPWLNVRFDGDQVREVVGRFLLTLYNTDSFYRTYSELDGFGPTSSVPAPGDRPPLDRWLLSRLQYLVEEVTAQLDIYEIHKAARSVEGFLINDLSNWYVRRSRRRVWIGGMTDDKAACYGTLREALDTLAKLCAPLIPFITEHIYQGVRDEADPISVHLADWPAGNPGHRDEALETAMDMAREVSEAVRAMRAAADIKNRQPLRRVVLVGEGEGLDGLEPLYPLVAEEANVKSVERAVSMDGFLERRVRPNMGSLGPKYKGDANQAGEAIRASDPNDLLAALERDGSMELPGGWSVTMDDLMVDLVDRGEFRTHTVDDVSVVLEIELDEDLMAEGLVREVVRRVQEMRKEMDLELEELVELSIAMDEVGRGRLQRHIDHLREEVRATGIAFSDAAPGAPEGGVERAWDIDGNEVVIGIRRAM